MAEEREIKTEYILDEIEACESAEDLKREILPKLRAQEEAWEKKINSILQEKNLSQGRMADMCGISRQSVNGWCKGKIPKNRETFLRIGLAVGYSEQEMDQLLQRYGHYSGLYSKSMDDCVALYVIRHGESLSGVERILLYDEILQRIHEKIFHLQAGGEAEIITTRRFDEALAGVKNEAELEHFIKENIAVFAGAYHRLYSYIEMHIQSNYMDFTDVRSISEIAQIQGWSSSLRNAVSEIRQAKWIPNRNKIISLGLHLCMNRDQVDEMLELAHMEPLYAKNIFETVIMFILIDAELNDVTDQESGYYHPDELCDYAREILDELGLPETESFLSELPEPEEEREEE